MNTGIVFILAVLAATPSLADNSATASLSVSGRVIAALDLASPARGIEAPEIVARRDGGVSVLMTCDEAGTVSTSYSGGDPGAVGRSRGDCGDGLAVTGQPGFSFAIAAISDAEITQPNRSGADVSLTEARCTASSRVIGTDGARIYCGVRITVGAGDEGGIFTGGAIPVTVVYD